MGLKTGIVEKATCALPAKLMNEPALADFFLVGKTALALRLGHRKKHPPHELHRKQKMAKKRGETLWEKESQTAEELSDSAAEGDENALLSLQRMLLQGDADAQCRLGMMYRHDYGVPQNV